VVFPNISFINIWRLGDSRCNLVVSGTLDFNPLTDKLKAADGSEFALTTPYGDELPQRGFDAGEDTYQAPPVDGSKVAFEETCAYYLVLYRSLFRFS
jgi:hypothetical protein